MRRHLSVGPVQPRIKPVGLDHGRLQIVWNDSLRHATQKGKHPDMGEDPVLQPFRSQSLSIGVIRGPHRRHEQLHGPHFAGRRINHINRVTSKIDEDLLSTHMRLAHRRPHPALPRVEMLAEPCIAKAVWELGAILFP